MYIQLIICHIKFLAPFLRNIDLPKPIALMYKGTLRVLLVLLHDFPELLCDYHFSLCDAIPPNCVQLRNLVLSAYPRNMRLPDPFMPLIEASWLIAYCNFDICAHSGTARNHAITEDRRQSRADHPEPIES
jgi:CCR4-NOT transcription complex subunit 1